MIFVKISNLCNMFGTADYKGINQDNIISGSQYVNKTENACVIALTDLNIIHADVVEITQEYYETYRQSVLDSFNADSLETKVKTLESQNAAMLLALVEGGLL